MDFRDLLQLYDVPQNGQIKLYRHAGDAELLQSLYFAGKLEDYQSRHNTKILECDLVGFFLGLPQNRGLFTGFYEPKGRKHCPNHRELAAASDEPWWKFGTYQYDLQFTEYLSSLRDRLVIDFGPPVRSANRWLEKIGELPVVEIRSLGRADAFPGYSSVRLPFRQLRHILSNPNANPDWHNALSSVSGIYAILVKHKLPHWNGHLYIGSATGGDNIWQRFSQYAATGHGGNKHLIEILEKHPDAEENFQFSILQTMPTTANRDDVLAVEAEYKLKLGTREFGLNAN